MALGGVGVNDIGIPNIDNARFIRSKIGDVIFVVIRTCMAKGKQRRCLADGAGTEPRARAILCSKIKGRAQDRNIRINLGPIGLNGVFPETAYPDKGQV
jgi:hypothetical protein